MHLVFEDDYMVFNCISVGALNIEALKIFLNVQMFTVSGYRCIFDITFYFWHPAIIGHGTLKNNCNRGGLSRETFSKSRTFADHN